MEKILITRAGFTALETELKTLKSKERPAVIQAIAEARELGDLITVDAALQNYLTDMCGVPLCDAQNWFFYIFFVLLRLHFRRD